MSAQYYETELRPKLKLIADDKIREQVNQLLDTTGKEENEAQTADQEPREMSDTLTSLIQQLNTSDVLDSIRNSAGTEVHDLVVGLINYAQSL